jgi:hypothetical protein
VLVHAQAIDWVRRSFLAFDFQVIIHASLRSSAQGHFHRQKHLRPGPSWA